MSSHWRWPNWVYPGYYKASYIQRQSFWWWLLMEDCAYQGIDLQMHSELSVLQSEVRQKEVGHQGYDLEGCISILVSSHLALFPSWHDMNSVFHSGFFTCFLFLGAGGPFKDWNFWNWAKINLSPFMLWIHILCLNSEEND